MLRPLLWTGESECCVCTHTCVYQGKLISDLMACVKLPKVTKSTWVVTLFRKKSGSWRYCPFLPSSELPQTQLSPQKILLAATLHLWVQISASAALLAWPHMHTRVEMTGHTHSTSKAVLRPSVRPQTTLGKGRRNPSHFPPHLTASWTSNHLHCSFSGSIQILPKNT